MDWEVQGRAQPCATGWAVQARLLLELSEPVEHGMGADSKPQRRRKGCLPGAKQGPSGPYVSL